MPPSAPPPAPFAPWRKSADLARAARAARERMGMTPTQLAARAKVSRKFVYDLEGGKETLRMDKVLAVLAALGLRAALMTGS